MLYTALSKSEALKELALQREKYGEYRKTGLSLDMSRGKPDREQLELSDGMLTVLSAPEQCRPETLGGQDMRNYGVLDGIPAAKELLADILDVPPVNVIVCGNSSLNIMYDTVVRCMLFGSSPETEPWIKQGKITVLCPVPGYDRHFMICQSLGIEMINIPMNDDGPDMDMIEEYVAADPQIKGIWCVPKYSNPGGVVYSDEVVRRFARLRPAANDFRIFWDNAYAVHGLYDTDDKLLNIVDEVEKAGNPHMVYEFASTSKITFPGSGIGCIAASTVNLNYIRSLMTVQTIGHDKLNMLRHVLFFNGPEGVRDHMKKHAAILRPKFEAFEEAFDGELSGTGVAKWSKPRGGYFISFDMQIGSAKRVWNLMNDCGVRMTNAGATYPYGIDPNDSNLRIAPSYPPVSEIKIAAQVLICCAKIAALEEILGADADA